MEGLAQRMSQQSQPTNEVAPVEQVMELLLQGITPEELVEKGVPKELVMEAIQMLEQQMVAQGGGQQQPQPQQAAPQGLAQTMASR